MESCYEKILPCKPCKHIFQKAKQSLIKTIQKAKSNIVVYDKNEKKNFFFNNFNPKFVSDNKLFWNAAEPLFPNKGS